jgi:hypothetical protein
MNIARVCEHTAPTGARVPYVRTRERCQFLFFLFGRGQINTALLSDKAVMTGNDPVMPMTGRMTVPGVFVA